MVKLVIIESPFAGPDRVAKTQYGWDCIRDSLERGEAPFASHLFYPMILADAVPADRNLGMASGWAWMRVADLVAVYTDRGISQGMREGITQANLLKIPVEYRTLESPK